MVPLHSLRRNSVHCLNDSIQTYFGTIINESCKCLFEFFCTRPGRIWVLEFESAYPTIEPIQFYNKSTFLNSNNAQTKISYQHSGNLSHHVLKMTKMNPEYKLSINLTFLKLNTLEATWAKSKITPVLFTNLNFPRQVCFVQNTSKL